MNDTNMNLNDAGGNEAAPSNWILYIAAAAVVAMGTQVKIPVAGGRLGPADVLAGISFLGILWHLFRNKATLVVSDALLAVLGLYCAIGIPAKAGLAGGIEATQRVEQLFAGFAIFVFLLRYRPKWLPKLLCATVVLSLLVALVQGFKFEFGSTLPPRDVEELKWGFGGAFTGLFRSRMALGLFLAVALAWVQPIWLGQAKCGKCLAGIGLATALVLGFIAHGQMLLIACVVLLVFGFLHSLKGGLVNVAAIALLLLSLLVGSRGAVLQESFSPMQEEKGILKTCHVELVAAMRMARRKPLTGVGNGQYQKYIGQCYGELPNPAVNTIETDTQSGYGILFGTTGFLVGGLVVLLLLAGLAGGLRAGSGLPFSRSGAAVLSVFLGAMWITDPFTRGTAWFIALGLASVAEGIFPRKMKWNGWIIAGIVFAALSVATVAFRSQDVLARDAGESRHRPKVPTTVAEDVDFFRVIDAGDAVEISAPMIKASDPQAANKTILRIPDKSGTPGEGEEPGMKYGGARYDIEVPAKLKCKIWLRVWWEGSCGNTIYVKAGPQEKPLLVGNDGTYDHWHWMEAPLPLVLEKGTLKLELLNREDGIRVDQILITNDLEYYPQGIEVE